MMAIAAEIEEIRRATERLQGILTGISIDEKLRDAEIQQLSNWLKLHERLHHLDPFRSTALLIERCIEDQVIDEDERGEILEWCRQFDTRFSLPNVMKTAIRRLHGVLNGIGIDGVVNEEEVWGFRGWLERYETFKDHWPFSGAWTLVEGILKDGKVTETEKRELFEFCHRFAERSKGHPSVRTDGTAHALTAADEAVLESFETLCDRESKILFGGKTFCFTGIAKARSRRVLHDVVRSLGATPSTDVTPGLDYLVVGALSSPCWAYSSYGLKIKMVLDYRSKGRNTVLLHEDDFTAQANQART